jgi:hypothetical protein
MLPILNMGVWDVKRLFKIRGLKCYSRHSTISGMFDCNYLFYDNGSILFSNKNTFASGFQKFHFDRLTLLDQLTNKGIEWNYFRPSSAKGIMIITFNMSNNLDSEAKLQEIYQIIYLANQLKGKYCNGVLEYETYIMGDLKIPITESMKTMMNEYKMINNQGHNYLFHTNIVTDLTSSVIISSEKVSKNSLNCVHFIYDKQEQIIDIGVDNSNELNTGTEEPIIEKEEIKCSPISSVKSSASDEWTHI